MQDLILDLVQPDIAWQDREANHRKYKEMLLERSGAHLTLLPEMYDTGFTMTPESQAEGMDGSGVEFLLELSKELGTVGASMIIREGDEFFNSMVMAERGSLSARYDKRHLFRMAGEHQHYAQGKDRVVTKVNGWRVLLQVCYDLRFPVFSRNRSDEQGPEYDAVVYVANWPERRREHWLALLRARAIENQCYAIGVNRVGTDDNGIDYSGDTTVVGPWGETVMETEPGKVGVFRATLLASELEDYRERFPVWRDADRFYLEP